MRKNQCHAMDILKKIYIYITNHLLLFVFGKAH